MSFCKTKPAFVAGVIRCRGQKTYIRCQCPVTAKQVTGVLHTAGVCIEVAAFEVPSGHVDGDLMPPSEAGIAAGEPDGDPVAVFLFGADEDVGTA